MLKDRKKLHIHCNECLYQKLCLPRKLTAPEIDELNSFITQVAVFEADEHVYLQNQKMHNLYAVYSGYCEEYWVDENGNECIENFFLPGDILGLEHIAKRKYLFSAIPLTKVELCVIPIDPLLAMMQTSHNLLERFISISSYKLLNNTYSKLTTNAKSRVANFLLNMLLRYEERNNNSHLICLPMSQIAISNYLGMANETVSRVLHEFARLAIIRIESKSIFISDVDKLKEIASPIESFGQTD